MAGRSLEVALYSFAMSRGSGLYFFYFNPFALWALPLYSLTETQGERRVNSITSIVGIFNPSPRRYTPQLSPIFFCATHRNASGHGKGRRLNTNDFLSLSKKVLVTLIRFICSFFSTARRTNQEAPPLLSGFWVRRYGRRRGLRNSLRSNIPRPFPSVSSPLRLRRPIKAESGIVAFACILTPSVLLTPPSFGHLPYILLCKTPRNATGHGKGRV